MNKLNKTILSKKNGRKSASGITLIALVITIIVLLILAGVTIAMLTGSDSAPAKANYAKQANDIGAMKDEISLVAQNAQMDAYNDVYVDNNSTVTRGQASITVGQKVIDEILKHFGGTARGSSEEKITKETTRGNVTVKIEQEFEKDAKITVSTTDVEKEGTVAYKGGALIWGEVADNNSTQTGGGGSGTTYTAYSIGQEVIVGTGANAQHFYVLEASDSSQSTVTLLAKYNLSNTVNASGHYMQAPNANSSDTSCDFSNTNYWATNWATYYDHNNTDWDPYPFQVGTTENNYQNSEWTKAYMNLNNELIPTNGDNAETLASNVILKAQDYATAVEGTNGRLLTYEEADTLKTSYSDMIYGKENGSTQSYLYYWLGSAYEYDNYLIKIINGDSECFDFSSNGDYEYEVGVRPVITISKTLVKSSE